MRELITSVNKKDLPKLIGTFIQPWFCEDWSLNDWKSHYDSLLEADIHLVIIQWVAETPNGNFKFVAYPSKTAENCKAPDYSEKKSLLENALSAAEDKGIKVMIGLNVADEWWKNEFTSEHWQKLQADTGNLIAKEIYDLYKGKFPNAFWGWYWTWEFYNNTSHFENDWANMMNIQLDYLTLLDKSLPTLFSPFISKFIVTTPVQLEAQWTSFFEQTHFREGDIFCSQDSVGASELPLEYLENQIAAMKKAALKKPEISFWINAENFIGASGDGPAPLERFKGQLKMESKYTDKLITYSYSHYYSPQSGNGKYHDQYLSYIGKKNK